VRGRGVGVDEFEAAAALISFGDEFRGSDASQSEDSVEKTPGVAWVAP
jgi:hypothetical protein